MICMPFFGGQPGMTHSDFSGTSNGKCQSFAEDSTACLCSQLWAVVHKRRWYLLHTTLQHFRYFHRIKLKKDSLGVCTLLPKIFLSSSTKLSLSPDAWCLMLLTHFFTSIIWTNVSYKVRVNLSRGLLLSWKQLVFPHKWTDVVETLIINKQVHRNCSWKNPLQVFFPTYSKSIKVPKGVT